MKSVGELMLELGFREDSSDDVKKAFVLNLIKAAAQSDALRGKPVPPPIDLPTTQKQAEPEQLSFDLGPVSKEAIHSLETLKRMRARQSRKSS